MHPGTLDPVDLDDVADSNLVLAAAAADDRVHRGLTLCSFGGSGAAHEGGAERGASEHAEGQAYGAGPDPVKPRRF